MFAFSRKGTLSDEKTLFICLFVCLIVCDCFSGSR